jgi:hypothetical protein
MRALWRTGDLGVGGETVGRAPGNCSQVLQGGTNHVLNHHRPTTATICLVPAPPSHHPYLSQRRPHIGSMRLLIANGTERALPILHATQ